MKKAFLAITLMLLFCTTAYSQPVFEQEEIKVPELPFVEIMLSDVITILAEFNVVAEDNPTFCRQFYGLTDFDNKVINICSKYDTTMKQKTLLHEMLHIIYWKRGVYTGGQFEHLIDARASEIFLNLYGFKKE